MAIPTILDAKARLSEQIEALRDKLRILEMAESILAAQPPAQGSRPDHGAGDHRPHRATQMPQKPTAAHSVTPIRKPRSPATATPPAPADLLTIAEIAALDAVHITTVYTDIKAGLLHPMKGPRPVRCERAEVERWRAVRKGGRQETVGRPASKATARPTAPIPASGRTRHMAKDDEEEHKDRARLQGIIRGPDRGEAIAAYREYREKYPTLRLPLDEQRLGLTA